MSGIVREVTVGPCRLIQGDCREVLPLIGKVDAIITDPPYERMKGGQRINWTYKGVADRYSESMTVGNELGDASAMSMFPQIATKCAIAFCSFHWIEECVDRLGGTRKALITWVKRNSPPVAQNAPWFSTEFAWAVQYGTGIQWRSLKTHLDYPLLQGGCMATERLLDSTGKTVHPTQKPLALMRNLILPGMGIVCDPYLGTGTTGLACIEAGRQFIGIEKDEKYFDISVKRIQSAWISKCSELPFEEPPKEVQGRILFDE